MFGKALKSIKNALNEVKDTVKETMKETVSTVSNPSQNSTFKINGKNYYQEKLLGEGGYGYVFEVSDPQGNRYALKKMNILSNNQYQNILREIKIWKQISNCQNKRVIWVGRFDYQKRPLEMVQIWQQIHPAFPEWHLDIYGEGVQMPALQNAISSQNMNIHLHEPTNQLLDAYRHSSLLVATSLYEPFGLVIPEAMSCGLPVISYDSPFGPASIISDGNDGFLIENDNQEMFVNRLSRSMHDEPLRMFMGMNAIESSKRFSSDIIMPKWETLFSELYS